VSNSTDDRNFKRRTIRKFTPLFSLFFSIHPW
jgi:hypothetical protein